jgi:hypothetical protein
MGESPPGPLYSLGDVQTGKSKKKFDLSLAAAQTGIEVSAIAPYSFKEQLEDKK